MSIIIGLTGKPNTGKSTFFKAATMADIEIGNYPFTTINPNYGIAYIQSKCPCTGIESNCLICNNGIRSIPINLIDVAGLVPNAHLGRGLGNKFLDDLRQADAIINVVDSSGGTDSEGNSIPIGSHDPLKDITFLNEEIELWIYELLHKNWSKILKKIKNELINIEDVLSTQLTGAGVKIDHVSSSIDKLNLRGVSILKWDDSIIRSLCHQIKIESRPMIIVANKADLAPEKNIFLLKSQQYPIYFVSAEAELILKFASKNKYINYISGSNNFSIINDKLSVAQINGLNKVKLFLDKYNSTGIQKCLDDIIFNVLHMIVVYPVEDENKWTNKDNILLPTSFLMKYGSTCYDLAKKIHTDMSSSFLYAINGKTKKRVSEKYILQNNDIIKIVFVSH